MFFFFLLFFRYGRGGKYFLFPLLPPANILKRCDCCLSVDADVVSVQAAGDGDDSTKLGRAT